jgi:hypothetical protein
MHTFSIIYDRSASIGESQLIIVCAEQKRPGGNACVETLIIQLLPSSEQRVKSQFAIVGGRFFASPHSLSSSTTVQDKHTNSIKTRQLE